MRLIILLNFFKALFEHFLHMLLDKVSVMLSFKIRTSLVMLAFVQTKGNFIYCLLILNTKLGETICTF